MRALLGVLTLALAACAADEAASDTPSAFDEIRAGDARELPARFRTESGSVVRFARHRGEKEFPACA